jgi:hypothetical protein
MDFWRAEPAPPGLTGAWADPGESGRPWPALARLWRDPGGFGNVAGHAGAEAAAAAPDPPGTEVD